MLAKTSKFYSLRMSYAQAKPNAKTRFARFGAQAIDRRLISNCRTNLPTAEEASASGSYRLRRN